MKGWSLDLISFILESSLVMQGMQNSVICTRSVPFISQEDGHCIVCLVRFGRKKSMEQSGVWKILFFIGLEIL